LNDRYLLFGIGASKFRNIHEVLKIEETGVESYIRGIPLLDTQLSAQLGKLKDSRHNFSR
jgi:hypothetical protein